MDNYLNIGEMWWCPQKGSDWSSKTKNPKTKPSEEEQKNARFSWSEEFGHPVWGLILFTVIYFMIFSFLLSAHFIGLFCVIRLPLS